MKDVVAGWNTHTQWYVKSVNYDYDNYLDLGEKSEETHVILTSTDTHTYDKNYSF
jgi:hypothetical protein